MRRLDAHDAGRVGRFLGDVGEIDADEPFPVEYLAALGRLVPSDQVVFSELDRVEQRSLGVVCHGDLAAGEPEVSYWDIRGEHPVCHHHERTRDWSAAKLTDFVPLAKLRKTRLYAEWYRPDGVENELTVGLAAPLWHTKVFLFRRTGRTDFAERDCGVLDALRQRLAERWELVATRRRLAELTRMVETRCGAIALLDGTMHCALVTDAARELFERYLGPVDHALPAPVRKWLACAPGQPLRIAGREGVLVLQAEGDVLLLTEEQPASRLTWREREVLELVRDGLTNAAIAERLWISPGTVRRHLENAYAKLGVHTRTAAVRALEGASRDLS